jgi:hypothetical protein
MKHLIIRLVVWSIIIGNILLLALVAFWLLQSPALPNIKEPIQVVNKNQEIAVGEIIELELEIRKPDNLVANSQSVFLTCNDGNLVTLAANQPSNLPKGEYNVKIDRYALPPKVSVGTICTFHIRNVYNINPLKQSTIEWKSQAFKII